MCIISREMDLSVESVKKSSVIEMRLKHKDPQIAAAVLNTLAELYMVLHLAVYKTPQSFRFFQDQSRIMMTQLGKAEGRLEAFKKQHHVTSMDEERTLLLRHEGELRTDLNRTLSGIAETENRIELPSITERSPMASSSGG